MKVFMFILFIIGIILIVENSISAYNGTLSEIQMFSFGFLCAGFLSLLISLIFN